MAEDDIGYVCRFCGRFHSDAEVKEWETRWEERNGEKWLVEIAQKCPYCGEISRYEPNEAKVRFEVEESKVNGDPPDSLK